MKLSTLFNLAMPNMSTPDLFKSRKFWVSIIGIFADIVIAISPEFEPIRSEMIVSVTTIIGIVIGGYGLEDIAIAFKTGQRNVKYDPTLK